MASSGRFPPRESDPVPIVQDPGWTPGPVWTGEENPASHRVATPRTFSPKRVAIPATLAQRNGVWVLTGLYWLRIGPINLLPEAW